MHVEALCIITVDFENENVYSYTTNYILASLA